MATEPKSKKRQVRSDAATMPGPIPVAGKDVLADPSAGMVLHRVLAQAARTFLLERHGRGAPRRPAPQTGSVGPAERAADRPAPLGPVGLDDVGRQPPADHRGGAGPPEPGGPPAHPLQPAHLPPTPRPGLGHLAPGRAGLVRRSTGRGARPPHPLGHVTVKGPEVLDPDSVDLLDSVVGMRMAAALAAGGRRTGRGPTLPAQRADDGALGGPRVQGQGQEAGRRAPPAPCSTGPGTTCGARPARPASTAPTPTSTSCASD